MIVHESMCQAIYVHNMCKAFCVHNSVLNARYKRIYIGLSAFSARIATTMLLTTLTPEDTFQLASIGHNDPHNWCIRPLLEHSLLLRFTQGCKIFLSAIMGHVAILLVAMIVNNLDQDKGYPTRWF